jgi:SOS-response transcriptional repressor LexA
VFQVTDRATELINEPTLSLGFNERPLSDRQVAIIRFVEGYVQQHRHPPSIRDISRGVGISSTSNVTYHINRLIEQGYLSKQPGTSRTLVVLSSDYQDIGAAISPDWIAEMAALRVENRRLREWCRQLERERAWERKQRQEALAS